MGGVVHCAIFERQIESRKRGVPANEGPDSTGRSGGQLMAACRPCRMILRESHAVRRGRRNSEKLVTTNNIAMPAGSGTALLVVTLIAQLSYPETAVNELAVLLSIAANPNVIGSALAEKSG